MRGGHDEARPAAAPDLHSGSPWRTRSRCQRGDLGPTAFLPVRLLQDVGRCAHAPLRSRSSRSRVTGRGTGAVRSSRCLHGAAAADEQCRSSDDHMPGRAAALRRSRTARRSYAGAGSAGVRSFHQRMSTCVRRRWRWHQFPLAPVVPVPRAVPVGGLRCRLGPSRGRSALVPGSSPPPDRVLSEGGVQGSGAGRFRGYTRLQVSLRETCRASGGADRRRNGPATDPPSTPRE